MESAPPMKHMGFAEASAGLGSAFVGMEPHTLSREEAIRTAIRVLDLTSLSPNDDEGAIVALCARAIAPVANEPDLHVGGVCVSPRLVAVAAEHLSGTAIRVASVAGNFPSGRAHVREKAAEAEAAMNDGAQEIDLVIDWRAHLSGNRSRLFTEVLTTRTVIGDATLKVILETSEFPDLASIEYAAKTAIAAGADFLKTSTGCRIGGATRETVVLFCLLAASARLGGQTIGVKPSGGVQTVEDALSYLAIGEKILHPDHLGVRSFRIGASSLLDRLIREMSRMSLAPSVC